MLAILAFIAYAVQYSQKINMSVAIICMVNNNDNQSNTTYSDISNHSISDSSSSSSRLDQSCQLSLNNSQQKSKIINGEFNWNKELQGSILAAYFVGYILTQILGGWLSVKFGSKIVLGISILIASLLTVVLPLAARIDVKLFILARFIIGAAHGVFWPSFSQFWVSWAPPLERSRLISISNAGAQIGNVIALPLGGFLCEHGLDGGWPSIFYVFGLFGLVWFVLWMLLSANNPAGHRFIGQNEKEYIEHETKETTNILRSESKSKTPWIKIMTSRPALAIMFGHCCSNFGMYLFLTSLPTYMKEVLKFDVKSNGTLSAIPYLVFWIFIVSAGFVGDKMVKLGVEKIAVRKLFNTIGFVCSMLAVCGLMVVTCHTKYVGVFLLTLGLASTGLTYGAGWLVNYNEISGVYSGIVFGYVKLKKND